jgi:hypothetical protein
MKAVRKSIVLDPELFPHTANWNAEKFRHMAAVWTRWARQCRRAARSLDAVQDPKDFAPVDRARFN